MINYATLLLLLVPLLGAIVCALLPSARAAKWWALLVSLVVLGLAITLAVQFDWKQDLGSVPAAQQLEKSVQLRVQPGADSMFRIRSLNASLSLGLDSISFWLVAMTALLMPLSLLASFTSIVDRAKEYYAWMLMLLFAMLGVFVARDLLLFYIFFELTLVPMFFIIGIWGGPERRHAAGKFFLFTFSGSVFTLITVVYLGVMAGSFELGTVTQYAQLSLSQTERYWAFLGLLAGFAVKVPLFPVHTWLPLAHTEAPTAGSVVLAGVLLKLGTYGILRLAMPLGLIGAEGLVFEGFLQAVAIISIMGVIYGALIAWVQQDIKKLVAYSSVSHLGFCVLGLAAFNDIGMQGSVMYMINHGLSTGALFLVVGMIYERFHTRDIDELSGLGRKMPILAFFLGLFTLSSIGLPGLNGFVSEFLTILGAFHSQHLGIVYGVFAATGIVLAAIYMLHMVARILFGPLKTPAHEDVPGEVSGHHEPRNTGRKNDINAREITVLVPLALAVVVLGVLPKPVLDSIEAPIQMIRQPAQARLAAETAPDAGAPDAPIALAAPRVAGGASVAQKTIAQASITE